MAVSLNYASRNGNAKGRKGSGNGIKERWERFKDRMFPLRVAERAEGEGRRALKEAGGLENTEKVMTPSLLRAAGAFREAAEVFGEEGDVRRAVGNRIKCAETYMRAGSVLRKSWGRNEWKLEAAKEFAKAAEVAEEAILANARPILGNTGRTWGVPIEAHSVPGEYRCGPECLGLSENASDKKTLHQRYTGILYFRAGTIAMDEGEYALAKEWLTKAGRTGRSVDEEMKGLELLREKDYFLAIESFGRAAECAEGLLHLAGLDMRRGKAYIRALSSGRVENKAVIRGFASVVLSGALEKYAQLEEIMRTEGSHVMAGECAGLSEKAGDFVKILD
jgi:tetratricopeptide (TPR) repeat protein